MTLSFYDNPDLEDGFNIWPHPWRTQGHRGLDFAKSTGTPIPSVNPGVVVISEWNKYLGWIVEVRGDDGVYVGYCHMHTQGLPVGTRVDVGMIVGEVGNTGTQSQGAHLHITKGDRQGAVRGASLTYLSDPWPYIAAAKTSPAYAEEEDETMKFKAVCHTEGRVQTVVIGEIGSGWKFKYTTGVVSGRNPENEKWAKEFDTGDFVSVTDPSMLAEWERSLDAVRQGK